MCPTLREKIITVLKKHGPSRPSEIGKILNIQGGDVCAKLTMLVDSGLVHKDIEYGRTAVYYSLVDEKKEPQPKEVNS